MQSVSRAIAVIAVAVALLRSIAAIWFSSDVVVTPGNTEAGPPLSTRVLVIVIDGLRHDTALESDAMPKLQALGRRGARGVSLASRVTMTGLGVRTLGTGTSPGLADILLETQLPRVAFDNVFSSLRRRGGHIAWIGNPAWKELFGADIDIDSKVSRSLMVMSQADNVWGADTVIVARAIKLMARTDWQLGIVHLGGLDNASHRFTPSGAEFRRKARAVDDDIAEIVAAAGPATTAIITSDHGTSDAGHHGSGEPITRRTPLVLSGAAVAPGRVLDARQTDIAPTIAALLGLPIPAPSEGQVLVDALAIAPGTASALRAANLRQHERYATAYAAAHGIARPSLDATPEGAHRLGDWIEASQASSSWGPALWAAALLLIVLGALAGRPAAVTAALVTVMAIASIATGGTSELLALATIAVLGVATVSAACGSLHRRLPWPMIGLGLVAIASIEGLFAIYKLHHRFLEMKMHDVHDALALTDRGFQLCATILVTIAATALARRWWPKSRGASVAILFVASALADSWAIPAAVAIGVAAVLTVIEPRERAAIVAVSALGLIAIWLPHDAELELPLDVVAPLALAGLGAWLAATTAGGRVGLLALGVAAAAVRIAGSPALPYRITLVAIAVVAVAIARHRRETRPLVVLGVAAAIALAMLSRSSQVLGLVAWTCFAGLVGRSPQIRASDDRAILAATLAVIACRFACFAVFEGVFEFSHLEVWVAYQGNPGTAVAFGAAMIAIKFTLPLVFGFALIAGNMTWLAMRTVMAWTIGFLCLRIAHIAAGMTVAQGTFYSPYLDSGQLAFTYLMLASACMLALALAIPWRSTPIGPGRSLRWLSRPGASARAACG